MSLDPSSQRKDAIVGKKTVENAEKCARIMGVSEAAEAPEVQGRGTVRKLVQDPYCLAFVFADLPADGSNVGITCPSCGKNFYASVMERL
jgi:hypothetical protein